MGNESWRRHIDDLLRMQNHRCAYCGKRLYMRDEFLHEEIAREKNCTLFMADGRQLPVATVDHVVKRSEGGSDAIENLRACCAVCNYARERKMTLNPNCIDCGAPVSGGRRNRRCKKCKNDRHERNMKWIAEHGAK